MNEKTVTVSAPWGLSTEKFFYFFMGLRKGEIRKQVKMMRERYPEDSPSQLARRFVIAEAPLSILGGVLLHAPILVPKFGPALKLLGVATGSAVMIRLNMTLVLQIAMAFGHDIDDRARLKEVAAIIVASGLVSSTSLFPRLINQPYDAVVRGGAVVAVSQLIGEAAIRYYDLDARAARAQRRKRTLSPG